MHCQRSVEENLSYVIELASQAARRGANIVCLPEHFLNPYFPIIPKSEVALQLAKPLTGPVMEQLSKAARQNGIYLVAGSLCESDDTGSAPRYFNTAPVFDD